jgi:hypothetical protein
VLTAPTWVSVPAYDLPAAYPQPGGGSISPNDSRLRDAYDRYGTIYTTLGTQHVPGNPSANANDNVYWYEINASASTAASHAITDPNIAYFAPGIVPGCQTLITPCPASFVALEFSGSSSTQPASAFYQLGSGLPTRYQQGVPGYTLIGAWGDYPGAAPDPANSMSVWVLGEYAAQTSAWGTAVTSLSGAAPQPTPSPSPSPSPATSYKAAILADSPAIYYRLDESSGSSAADSSGHGHTAAYTSSAILNQAGATSDGDAAISGSGEVVKYAAGAGLPTGSAARSVEAWFKTTTDQRNVVLACWGTETSNQNFALMINNATQMKVGSWQGDYNFNLGLGQNAFDGSGTKLWRPSTAAT